MGLKVYKSDLNSAQLSSMLDNDIQDTDKLIAELNSFVSGTTQSLTGPAYEVARQEIASFIPILEQRKTTANEIKNAISSAMSQLSGYMGPYDYLDDSNLEMLENEINKIKASYESIKAEYSEKYDTNFLTKAYLNYEITNINNQCASKIAPLQDEIEKIKGLAGADASAYGCLSGISSSSYKSAISNK